MHGIVQFRVIEERTHHGSGKETRADRVDVDPLRCVVDRELAGEVHHRALRYAVSRLGGQPHEATYRGDVDDLATRDLAASILLPEHLGDGEPTPSHTLFTFTAIVKSYCSSVSSTMVWSPANTPALLTMTSSRPTDHGYALAGED